MTKYLYVKDKKTCKELNETFFLLTNRKDISADCSPWEQRYRKYMKILMNGTLSEIAEVVVKLKTKTDKGYSLSFGERRCLEAAKKQLTTKIAEVTKQDTDEIRDQIETALENNAC